jgi:hypothetical protein
MEKPRRYYAYLLRLWLGDSPNQPAWRASLEDVHSHEITGFSNLAALFEFLGNLTDQSQAEHAQSTQTQSYPNSEKENKKWTIK